MNNKSVAKKMLVFHSAYTFDYLKAYGMEIFVQGRDAGDFFKEILTISPMASLQYSEDDSRVYSKPEFFELDSKNRILEGRVARYNFLRKVPVLNFLISQISLMFALIKSGKLRDVQLVRAEDPRLNGLYGFVFSKILRKPFVVGVWGNAGRLRDLNQLPMNPRLFPTIKSEELFEKFILRRADAVLAQNQENLNYALEAGVEPTKTHFTELGVGIDKSHFLAYGQRKNVRGDFEAWGALETCVLVCISRLEASKMVNHAIKASKSLKEADIDFKLILIGDGRELENLKTLVKKEGLANQVIFAGNRSQEWIAGALNFVDINVAPLCGRSLLEASLGGVPAVSYDVDWHSEIVIPGSTGFLVQNLDFSAMGAAILELCRDEKLRKRMGTSMHEKALDLASPEKIALRQRMIYQNLVFNKDHSAKKS